MIDLEWLYPSQCALCARLEVEQLCSECRSAIDLLALDGPSRGPEPITLRVSGYRYDGRAAQAVRRLKYSRVMTHVPAMAQRVLELAEEANLMDCDAFVPVPIHWTRLCERGFNQAEVLCDKLPKVEGFLLRRRRRTRQQVGLTAEMRAKNLLGAFAASENVAGKWIVLVDDVTTSGGTGHECAKALKQAGAIQVDLLTYCSGGAIGDL